MKKGLAVSFAYFTNKHRFFKQYFKCFKGIINKFFVIGHHIIYNIVIEENHFFSIHLHHNSVISQNKFIDINTVLYFIFLDWFTGWKFISVFYLQLYMVH